MTPPLSPEQFLHALVLQLQDHFAGQYEPGFVGLARQYLATLPTPPTKPLPKAPNEHHQS